MKKLIEFKDTLRVGDEVSIFEYNIKKVKVVFVGTGGFISKDGFNWNWWNDYEMEITKSVAPSWDNLRAGDIIVKESDERTILAVMGNVFLRSIATGNNDVASTSWRTKEEAQAEGWEVKGSEDTNMVDDKSKEAMELLKSKGYKIIKE